MKFKKYKSLPNLEVSEIINWNKPYNQIVIPEGCRLIKIYELMKLLESEEMDEFLGDYKGKYNLFWCEQTKYAKANKYSSRLCFGWDLGMVSNYDDLASSDDDGRVVFVREVGKIK